MNKFVPIHIFSSYNFLKSGLTMARLNKVIDNYPAFGLSDDALHALAEFSHLMKANNKKFVFGLNIEIDGLHFVFYIKNEVGYKNAIKLSLLKQNNDINLDTIANNNDGLNVVLETNEEHFLDKFEGLDTLQFAKWLNKYTSLFKEELYFGLEIISKDDFEVADKIRNFAEEHTYKCLAFPKIKYLKKDDDIIIKILKAIDEGTTLDEKQSDGLYYFYNEPAYHKIYHEEEIDNIHELINSTSFDFDVKRGNMLRFSESNSDELLKSMTYTKLEELNLKDDTHVARLDYELSVISSMGYSDYFLLVQDYVNYAKSHDILVGPGRGSAAGSLVSYLLNITEVDPLKYGLQFERFLNPNRTSMPDIDVDFIDTKRDQIINYLRERYGKNKVSYIVTFQTIGAKQALRDIARVYNYPERHISLLSKNLTNPHYSLAQSYHHLENFKKLVDSDKYFQEIISLANKIESIPRQTSLHAAGIILNNSPLEDALPVSLDFEDNYITQYEAKYLEEQGFLKMDILGLRNLSTIDYCVDLINKNHPEAHIDKLNIPYDEKEVYELIRNNQTAGIFQIDTVSMKRGINIIKPNCFDDVVALLAINRPGPMAFMKSFADRKDGKEKINYISEALKDVLSPTYGIIVYQEQVNQIAVKMAGFSLAEADIFRRAISKKDKAIIEKLKKSFIDGSIKNGYDEKTASTIFAHIERFAEYGFNKSHSVVYAMFACRMAWLKHHYPEEFYIAILETSVSSNDSSFNNYLLEMRRRNISLLLPSINKSQKSFVSGDKGLLFPLSGIKNLTDIFVNQILEEREKNGEFKDFFAFIRRMYKYKINENQIIRLIDSGAFDGFNESRETLRKATNQAMQFAELVGDEDQANLGIPLESPLLRKYEGEPLEDLEKEYNALGIMISNNPLEYKKEKLEEYKVTQIIELNEGMYANIAGIIRSKKVINTSKGQQMAFVKMYDQTGEIELTIFPRIYETSQQYLEKNTIIVTRGRLENKDGNNAFIVEEISKLEE